MKRFQLKVGGKKDELVERVEEAFGDANNNDNNNEDE